MGLGLIYVSPLIAVSRRFTERRALAVGLAMCGAGVGALAVAPLTQHLLTLYGGWRGAMLIQAGLALNGAVVGALMPPKRIENDGVDVLDAGNLSQTYRRQHDVDDGADEQCAIENGEPATVLSNEETQCLLGGRNNNSLNVCLFIFCLYLFDRYAFIV